MKPETYVCPKCGRAALRCQHGGETALIVCSPRNGQRYCIRCGDWVVGEFRREFERKHGLVKPATA